MTTDVKEVGRNPKRELREGAKTGAECWDRNKIAQAMKLQQEQLKTKRKTMSQEYWDIEKQRQFELKQQKRK